MKRFKNLTILSLLLVFVFTLASCGGQEKAPENENSNVENTASNDETSDAKLDYPITIKHASGETVIEKEPMKIVVCDTAALDTLDAIGAGDKVVGTVTKGLPEKLKKYESLQSVGTAKEPDMEQIALLEPDLVFIGNRMSKMYNEFSQNWKTIDSSVKWTDLPEGVTYSEQVPENVMMVANAVGMPEEGQKKADEITALINQYKDMGKGKGKVLVLMSNEGEISMHGPASRWAPIFDVFGFENVDYEKEDDGHKGQKISFETVQEINPDWIFVLDRDAATGSAETGDTAAKVMDNDLVNSTNAAKNGHIVYLSPQEWYIVMTGADNFQFLLNEIGNALK